MIIKGLIKRICRFKLYFMNFNILNRALPRVLGWIHWNLAMLANQVYSKIISRTLTSSISFRLWNSDCKYYQLLFLYQERNAMKSTRNRVQSMFTGRKCDVYNSVHLIGCSFLTVFMRYYILYGYRLYHIVPRFGI